MHKITADKDGWITVRIDPKYEDPWTRLDVETVIRPSRPDQPHAWTVVHRRAAAVVAAFTREGRLVLIRQERIPLRAALWEFPAGQIDEAHEDDDRVIHETARRELREESGYVVPDGSPLEPLGLFFTSPGFTDEHGYLFVARDAVRVESQSHHDAGESILEVREFSVPELRRMIASGESRDANTLAVFARMCAMGIV